MSFSFTKTLRYLPAVCLFFCFKISNAQDKYEKLSFRIDSLANVGLPKSALKEVDRLDAWAHTDNNAPQQIKAVIYRMTFQSYLEENALAAIITRLKADIDKANFPVRPVLQSVLAQMYWEYYKENRYSFGQRSKLEKKDADFRNWDIQTIIDEASRLYALSLQDAVKEQTTPVGVLDGVLQGDRETRYLRPTLYDLLVHRAFDFYLSNEAAITKPRLPFTLNDARLFGDSRTFAGLDIKTTDTASTLYKGFKYLQLATNFHLTKNDRDALADLDIARFETLYAQSNIAYKDSLYLNGLRQISADFSANPISTKALVLIGNYYKEKDSLTIAHSYYKKAVAAYPKSIGGKNAALALSGIEGQDLSASVENVNGPGRPLLGLVRYTNVKEAKIAIYAVSKAQLKQLTTGYDFRSEAKFNTNLLKLLKAMQPLQVTQLALPGTQDHRRHTAEFKINALPIGSYIVVVSDAKGDNLRLKQWVDFAVTGLACSDRLNPDGRTELSVADRNSGAPLEGVKVNIVSQDYVKDKEVKKIIATGLSDKNGKYLFKFKQDHECSIELTYKNDSFTAGGKYFSGVRAINDEDKEKVNTILFTDRLLYRPGQTVYFKGLQVRSINGKSEIMPGAALDVTLKDMNLKSISTLSLKTNEFGSVQGSFVIPQSPGSGRLSIATPNGWISVQVEEYKRPTFKVEFLPVLQAYHLTDSITLKGKVTSFSGYGLSHARVACRITAMAMPVRSADDTDGFDAVAIFSRSQEIAADTVYTNSSGELELKFKAGNLDDIRAKFSLTYSVNAAVTDASGETQTTNTTITVSSEPVKIEAAIPETLSQDEDTAIPLKLNNSNEQPQKGSVNSKIYALKQGQTFVKVRAWTQPDQYILTRDEFKKAFPAYSWRQEDEPKNWQVTGMVADTTITTDSVPGTLNLNSLRKQAPGFYKIIITARTDKGDTTSTTHFIEVVNGPEPALKSRDVMPVVKTVKPGGHIDFLVGSEKPSWILMEKYDGRRLLSSEWLNPAGTEKITIQVPPTKRNSFAVQFLMVNDNRMYHSYYQVKVMDTVKKLNLRFITFRNKLQPGEKEQWKLQVKSGDNEKQSAEMLAAMYDASLDDISPGQYWKTDYRNAPTYDPDYYAWEDDEFTSEEQTAPFSNERYSLRAPEWVSYEGLNLSRYDYYGGNNDNYQDYLQRVADYKAAQKADKKLADKYVTNAALVKKGYDISGRVVFGSGGLKGVKISIKGTGITTLSNSLGYFKIKVPVNAVLIFTGTRLQAQAIKTSAGRNMVVEMNYPLDKDNGIVEELKIADPGVKSLKGDKNSDMLVVNPDSKAAEYQSFGYIAPVVKADMESRRAPKAMMYDELYDKSLREKIMEVKTMLGGNFAKSVTIRKNFNETAFFYPQLHTDEKGQILIDFTIPEALTRWRFRGFAHTKDLQTGYIENEVVTQKQLSISANMPRFLREGDTVAVSARLANLTDKALKVSVKMELFNALNMQPVNLFLNKAGAGQDFAVDANTNKAVTFKLVIPAGLDALTYRLTADAGQYTDGEENTLPVLPNRTLVTESMPMMVRAGQSRSFTFDKLVNQNSKTLQNKTLTLEYTQNPAWYAVQALPYMMEFPYECSEQTFSRYYANSLAANLVSKLPAIKQVFDRWKAANSAELLSTLEKNQELKSTLIEETPWLKNAVGESEQKKRIALLFDLNKMGDELRTNLEKLQKKQLPNGSFPWFGGDRPDRYITQHILQGIGELYHLNISGGDKLEAIVNPALNYMDKLAAAGDSVRKKDKDYAARPVSAIEIQGWFARSFFLDKAMDMATEKAQANYLKRAATQWTTQNVYEQAMIALTMQRYKKPAVTQQIEKSLLETAQQNDEMGMYWGKNQRGYFWYESPVETQSMMIELFTEAGNNPKAVEEMKIWLLRNKQVNNWKTTTATAAACYALLLKGDDLLANQGESVIKINGKQLEELKPDVKTDAGTGYIKTSWVDEQVKPSMGKIDIKNNSANLSWGALHWQYLENLDKITSAQTNIQLTRKYFIQKQTDAGPVLVAVDATHQPKTGDLLKVVINLKADRDFEYVQLKDLRPAGTEPVEALSDYKYQDGLYYYQVSKDVATNFFISYLNKGNYVFEYQLRVAQPGNFSTGITTIQSMYAPEFNAHTDGGRMGIKP